jgi:hypothetical protein
MIMSHCPPSTRCRRAAEKIISAPVTMAQTPKTVIAPARLDRRATRMAGAAARSAARLSRCGHRVTTGPDRRSATVAMASETG